MLGPARGRFSQSARSMAGDRPIMLNVSTSNPGADQQAGQPVDRLTVREQCRRGIVEPFRNGPPVVEYQIDLAVREDRPIGRGSRTERHHGPGRVADHVDRELLVVSGLSDARAPSAVELVADRLDAPRLRESDDREGESDTDDDRDPRAHDGSFFRATGGADYDDAPEPGDRGTVAGPVATRHPGHVGRRDPACSPRARVL